MIKLIIDTNVLIPGGKKDEETIKSIKEFGNLLPELARFEEIAIYLSTEILGEYKSSVPASIKRYNLKKQLPKFHSSLDRNWNRIIQLLENRRKCNPIDLRRFVDLKLKFHVIQTTKLSYDVTNFINDEDKKFLKLALALARGGKIFIISVDRESLLKLDIKRLSKRYEEAKNIVIHKPKDFVEKVILPLLESERVV